MVMYTKNYNLAVTDLLDLFASVKNIIKID